MGRTTATTAQHRHSRRARVGRLARVQGGIVSRRQLYAAGLTRWEVRPELRAGRWAPTGKQTVRVGEAQPDGIWWRAVLEIGPSAAIDGVSALMIAGLRTIEESTVHVAVRKSSTPMRSKGVTVHETRRYREEDILVPAAPRARARRRPPFMRRCGRGRTSRRLCS